MSQDKKSIPEKSKHDIALSELAAANQVDEIADQYEAELIRGSQPEMEEFLDRDSGANRPLLFRELLLLEWDYQQKRGEELNFSSYESLFPDFKDVISEVQQQIQNQQQTAAETVIAQGDTASIASKNLESSDEEIDFLHSPQQSDEIGRLGNYRVLEVMGVGGMGIVFRAEDPRLKRQIALKAMKPAVAAIKSAKERFIQEAQATAAIEHDNIVHIYQVAEDDNIPFIAMQYLRGESLKSRLEQEGRLDQLTVLQIGRDVAAGLSAAHEQELVHRDIKPDNIWIEEKSGRAKILDFGLVRNASDDGGLTQSGMVLGTPRYMSPEQAQGNDVDYRCDLFSLGSVLYHLVSGKPPFDGKNLTATLMAVSHEEPEPVESLCPDLHPEFAGLIKRLLSKECSQRPQSATEVLQTLNEIERKLNAQPQKIAELDSTVLTESQETESQKTHFTFKNILISATACLLLAAVVFLLKTPNGTVKISISDPNANVSVLIDKNVVDITGLDNPLQFKVGPHHIEVKGEGYETVAKSFTVKQGDNPAVHIELLLKDTTAKIDPIKINPDRTVAEWVIANGGSVNVISGAKPIYGIRSIDKLPKKSFALINIHLLSMKPEDKSAFTSNRPKQLAELRDLRELDLRHPLLNDADMQVFKSYKHLTKVYLAGTQITGATLDTLRDNDNLKKLHIYRTKITPIDLKKLNVFPNLEELTIDSAQMSSIGASHVTKLDQLKSLKVNGRDHQPDLRPLVNSMVESLTIETGKSFDLSQISGMRSLEVLSLQNSYLSNADLAPLDQIPNLTRLNLSYCPNISDSAIPHIKKLSKLSNLVLIQIQISKKGIAELKAALPNCKISYEGSVEKVGTIPKPLEPLPGIIPSPEKIEGIRRWQVVLKNPFGGNAVWSPDGKWIAITDHNYIRLYAGDTFKLSRVLEGQQTLIPSWKSSVKWSPDGRWLATGSIGTSKELEIRLWNVTDDSDGPALKARTNSLTDVTTLAWSNDGMQLASGTYQGDKYIRVWNRDGNLLKTIPINYEFTEYLQWTSMSNLLFARTRFSKQIVIIDLEKNKTRLKSLSINYRHGFTFSSDCKRIAIARMQDNKEQPYIQVIDTEKQKVLSSMGKEIRNWAINLAWSPDGKFIAAPGQNAFVYVFDWKSGKITWEGYVESAVMRASWGPEGKYLVTSGADRVTKIWKIGSHYLAPKHVIPSTETNRLTAFTFSSKGKKLAFVSANNSSVKILDENGKAEASLMSGKQKIQTITWHPDGNRLATSDTEGGLYIWNQNGQLEKSLEGHDGKVLDNAWSLDGELFAASGTDKIWFWDKTGTLKTTIETKTAVSHLQWHPEGKLLAGTGKDNSVLIWNDNGTLQQTIDGDRVRIRSLSWSPDGRRLAISSEDGTVRLWIADNEGKLVKYKVPVIKTGDKKFYSFAWSPDSQRFATSGDTRKLQIWNIAGGLQQSLEGISFRDITHILWAQDTNRLLTASSGGQIHQWNLTDGKPTRVSVILPDGHLATFDAKGKLLSSTPGAEEQLVYLIERDQKRSLEVLTPEEFQSRFGATNLP